jgi:hypothetical protein
MDILQLIKKDHITLREMFINFVTHKDQDRSELRSDLETLNSFFNVQEHIDNELLFPEIALVYSKSTTFLDACRAQARAFSGTLVSLQERLVKGGQLDTEKTLIDLREALDAYLRVREEHLMPLIRKHLSTVEREELGAVYSDHWESFAGQDKTSGPAKGTKGRKFA